MGASLIAIDIRKFIPLEEFKAEMDDYIHSIKGMKKASFAKEIFLPGEIEHNNQVESSRLGINLDDEAVAVLNQMLAEVGSEKRLEEIG